MKICEKEACLGCGLCSFQCPTNSIVMITNDEGFLEPSINKKTCIGCEKCIRICPSINVYKKSNNDCFQQQYYLAWHVSDETRYNSSSGAAFSAIAQPIIEKGGIVIGAEYASDFTVFHGAVEKKDELQLLRKSKYLQSNIIDSYSIILQALKQKRVVLFTGTPCQCAAMELTFGDNDLFFSCDVICHGVQSPEVFVSALHYMEKKANSKCVSVDFRSKEKGWANACTTEVVFENGKKINKRLNDIPIGSAFLQNLSIRQSCENCKYRTIERSGDITIGDFWAIRDEPEYLKKYKDLGYSSIIVNSNKGAKLLNDAQICLHIEERTKEQIKYQNNPLYKQFTPNPKRKEFFMDFQERGFEYVWDKYLKPKKRVVIKWKIIAIARKIGLLKIYQKIRGVS